MTDVVIDKVQQKNPNWKGAMLSLGEVDFTELCTYC
jgi:hypothetical protein